MSYARFGPSSDVYIFKDAAADNSLCCFACAAHEPQPDGIRADYYFGDAIGLLEHLKEHAQLGHRVPILSILYQMDDEDLLPPQVIAKEIRTIMELEKKNDVPHVLLVTLPGHGVQHVVFCDSQQHARSLIEQGITGAYFEAPPINGRIAIYQTGPGTHYLMLARAEYDSIAAQVRAQQDGSAIIQPGKGRH